MIIAAKGARFDMTRVQTARNGQLARRRVIPWQSILIFAASAAVVVVVTLAVLIGGSGLTVILLVACFGAGSIIAALLDKPVAIIALLVIASAGQRAVAATFLDPNALWLDDIVLVGMILYVARHVLADSRTRTKLVIVAIVIILAIAVVRSANLGLGISQFRQMAVPMILLIFGSTLTKEQIVRAGPVVVGVILVGALYAIGEQIGFRPIDPLGVEGLNQYAHSGSREGLPNSYYYFFSDGSRFTRSGGLLLNPPSLGMLVATGVLWLWFTTKKPTILTVAATVIFVAAAFLAFGRGGFVILALVLFQPLLSRKSGTLAFLLVGVALAYVAASEWSADGESSRHLNGFFGGITYGLTHPFGGGFGTAGNSLSTLGIENDSGANESLAAILMASIGWAGIAIVGWLIFIGVRRGASLAGVALTSAILVSLVSETAGGLDATGPLWILAGFALSASANPKSPPDEPTYKPSSLEAPKSKSGRYA